MTDLFPVNSGNVPPPPSSAPSFQPLPSQSTHAFSPHAPNAATAGGPGMRRRKRKDPTRPTQILNLERVLGLTTASSNILATAESQDLIAYAAGAVVVLYNHKRNKQVGFLYPPTSGLASGHGAAAGATNGGPSAAAASAASVGGISSTGGNNLMLANSSFISPLGSGQAELSVVPTAITTEKKKTPASTRAKPISCLAFSPDGNYLAAGEMGHQPRILIWDVKERVLLHECRGHKFGVLSLAFSPNNRYLVSIGFQHDGYLYVWQWRKGIKLAGNKVTSKVNALSFSKNGSYFVTAGLRHVKYWYFDSRGRVPKRGNLSSRETQVLDGRSGILGVLRESNFVAVGCDRGTTDNAYFLTDSGILCMFKEGRVVDKWVDLQVQSAYSIAVSPTYVVCACAGGVIRLFEPGTLKYCGILPKPHPLGIDISAITSPEMLKSTEENSHYYPDAIAVAYDDASGKVTAVYSDRSLFLWDVHDLKKIGKYRSFIFHSDCVWGVEPSPLISDNNNNAALFPPYSFATYSGDGTVRFWNIDYSSTSPNSTSSSSFVMASRSSVNPSLPMSSGTPISPSSSTSNMTSNGSRRNIYSRELLKMLYVDPDAAEFSKFRRDVDVSDEQYPDFGIRAIKMSSDGKLIVTGDRNGNLRVHNMETWEQITYQEAHDSEILAMDITAPNRPDVPYMIATGSRDRLIHVFDINNGFQVLQTLDDHSSSITAVKFTKDAKKLISCGADKGVIFRSVEKGERLYATYHNYSGRGTVFDMSLDVNERYVATVTGERRLYVFSTDSGKPVRVCKPETAEEAITGTSAENSGGSLINIDLDPFSGTFAVTTGSDRCLRLFDLTNSSCIEKVCVHAELITSVKFLRTPNDSIRVVSTCSDGTIFVWGISDEIVSKMKSRCVDRDHRAQQMVINEKSQEDILDDRRAAVIRGAAAKPRFRRVSTATAVRLTPSVSQIARGERRTFSTMSPSEQKYEDLYKKMAIRRTNPLLAARDNSSIHNNNSSNDSSSISPPTRLANERKPVIANGRNGSNGSGRKTPEGKLERLYTGVPTTGARDRTISHVTPPSTYSPMSRFGAGGLSQVRQAPPPVLRMNPVLRRQISRETMNKIQQQSGSLGNQHKQRPKSDGGLRRKRSGQLSQRRASGSGASQSSGEMSSSNKDSVRGQKAASAPSSPPPIQVTAPIPADDEDDSDLDFLLPSDRSNPRDTVDDDGQEAGDEGDANEEDEDEEDEEDEEEDEEEVIFIAAEQDEIGEAVEVTSHDIQEDSGIMSSAENAEDGQKSASTSDDEKHANHDDEEGSSEENTDDAILQAITSREAPRMTPSLSRSTSVTTPVSRKSATLDVSEVDSLQVEIVSSVPVDGSTSPNGRDTPGLRELQRKLEKGRKRQSFTARYLLSLGATGVGESKVSPRASLNSIIHSFQELVHKKEKKELLTASKKDNLPPSIPVPGEAENISSDFATATMTTIESNEVEPKPAIAEDPAADAAHSDANAIEKREAVDQPPDRLVKHKSSDQLRGQSQGHNTKGKRLVSSNDMKGAAVLGAAPVQKTEKKHTPTTSITAHVDIDITGSLVDNALKEVDERTNRNNVALHVDNGNHILDVATVPESEKNYTRSATTVGTTHEDGIHESPSPELHSKNTSTGSATEKIDVSPESTIDHSHVLADLDGAVILLDSVLDVYGSVSTSKSSTASEDNRIFLQAIAEKLSGVADRIHKAIPPPSPSDTIAAPAPNEREKATPQDAATLALLDKYSIMLVQMVEQRLQSSKR
ncbi:hypothetical protein BX666DRAFT_1943426 [Dichotomocladium elegans]|nr:hypothetical protein BX666DRAFT_1943426 [Dichotomocladium elegans]